VRLNLKTIFLLDGIGAAISAVSTGLLLPLFSEELGLSVRTLYMLAVFPLAYGIYSLSCYRFVKETKPWMLMALAVANLVYCLIAVVLILFYEGLTSWGQAVLAIEIAAILGVVAIEVKVYREITLDK